MNSHIFKAKSILPFLFILICSIPAFSCADTDKPSSAQMKEAEQFNTLGESYFNQRKYQEAVDAYKQVIRIKPNDDNAHYDLGMTYLLLDNSDSALDQYNILKDLNKDLANKLFNDIGIHSRQK